jgi:hypothetical protein
MRAQVFVFHPIALAHILQFCARYALMRTGTHFAAGVFDSFS